MSINQPENLSERDRGRHEETSSRASTRSSMKQKPSQTENPTVCTGRLVLPTKSLDAGGVLEKKEECGLFCLARAISFEEKVNGRHRMTLNRR